MLRRGFYHKIYRKITSIIAPTDTNIAKKITVHGIKNDTGGRGCVFIFENVKTLKGAKKRGCVFIFCKENEYTSPSQTVDKPSGYRRWVFSLFSNKKWLKALILLALGYFF